MLLVLVLCVNPFSVHLTHIGLILVAEVVHTADQVIPLVGEVLKLFIKSQFVLAILDLCASEMLKLRVKVSNASVCCLVISF